MRVNEKNGDSKKCERETHFSFKINLLVDSNAEIFKYIKYTEIFEVRDYRRNSRINNI